VGLAGAPTFGYKAVESWLAGRKSDGIVFGAGALICLGTCGYCLYRVVTSLSSKNIASIPPTHTNVTSKADRQMLVQVEAQLRQLVSPPDEIAIQLDNDDPTLYDSIERHLSELKTLFPELREKVADLQGVVQRAMLHRSNISSPGETLESFVVGPDASFEEHLLGELDKLAKKVTGDQLSTNSSRGSSVASSPANKSSVLSSPVAEKKPNSKGTKKLEYDNSNSINYDGAQLSPIAD
jgi:hypothetical protein